MSKSAKIRLIIIFVLVLVILGFGAYFIIKYLDRNKETAGEVNEEYQENVSEYYEPTEEEKQRKKT